MDNDIIKKLNDIRNYLEISKDDFVKLLLLGINYQKVQKALINDDILCQLLEEALINIDYSKNITNNEFNSLTGVKTVEESFDRAICNLGYQKIKK